MNIQCFSSSKEHTVHDTDKHVKKRKKKEDFWKRGKAQIWKMLLAVSDPMPQSSFHLVSKWTKLRDSRRSPDEVLKKQTPKTKEKRNSTKLNPSSCSKSGCWCPGPGSPTLLEQDVLSAGFTTPKSKLTCRSTASAMGIRWVTTHEEQPVTWTPQIFCQPSCLRLTVGSLTGAFSSWREGALDHELAVLQWLQVTGWAASMASSPAPGEDLCYHGKELQETARSVKVGSSWIPAPEQLLLHLPGSHHGRHSGSL